MNGVNWVNEVNRLNWVNGRDLVGRVSCVNGINWVNGANLLTLVNWVSWMNEVNGLTLFDRIPFQIHKKVDFSQVWKREVCFLPYKVISFCRKK